MSASLFHRPRGTVDAPDGIASWVGTLVEVWEHMREGEPVDHHAWLTTLEVATDNAGAIVVIGRARWTIEHEQCNGHKNHG